MKSLFSHRSTRRTAAVMLFVWLLALATSMANACLLPSPQTRHRHAAVARATPRPSPGAPPGSEPPVAIRFLRLNI